MNLTFEDTQFIRNFEGFRTEAYPDPVSGGTPWTIGWGMTGDWVTPGLEMSEADLQVKFMEMIGERADQIQNLVISDLNKNQLIALVSFVWNLGLHSLERSTLLKRINANDPSASDSFLPWDLAGGHVVKGLAVRRQAERSLFDTDVS